MRPFERNVDFELVSQGKTIKIIAIDEETGVDISLVAAEGTPVSTLYQVAYEKLLYRLGKLARSA